MTEQEWLACETFWPMVQFLRKLGTDRRLVSPLSGGAMLRKIQLFVCAMLAQRYAARTAEPLVVTAAEFMGVSDPL